METKINFSKFDLFKSFLEILNGSNTGLGSSLCFFNSTSLTEFSSKNASEYPAINFVSWQPKLEIQLVLSTLKFFTLRSNICYNKNANFQKPNWLFRMTQILNLQWKIHLQSNWFHLKHYNYYIKIQMQVLFKQFN